MKLKYVIPLGLSLTFLSSVAFGAGQKIHTDLKAEFNTGRWDDGCRDANFLLENYTVRVLREKPEILIFKLSCDIYRPNL